MTRGDRNEESNKLEPCPGCNQAFALDSTSTSAGHAVIESGWMTYHQVSVSSNIIGQIVYTKITRGTYCIS